MTVTLTISLILFLLGSLIFSIFKTEEEIKIEESVNDDTVQEIETKNLDK